MSPQQTCDSEKMTDAATIRAVYPRHTMKLLARAMDVPLDTARHWLYRNLCAARRRELALALIAELDRQDAEERAAVRERLTAMAGGADAPVGSLPRSPAALADRAAGKATASATDGATAGATARRVERTVIRR